MHATVVLLMAMSGLGCHNKSCGGSGYASAPAACSTGCGEVVSGDYYPSSQVGYIDSGSSCSTSGYGSAGYSSGYSGGMYDASYAAVSCGSTRGCFGGAWKRGGGLFSCFKKNRGCYAPVSYGCDTNLYDTSYSTPVFGSYTPSYTGGDSVYSSSQAYGSGQVMGSTQYAPSSYAPATAAGMNSYSAPAADAVAPPTPPAPSPADAVPPAPAPADVTTAVKEALTPPAPAADPAR